MNGKNVNFGDKIIKKSDFYKNKKVTKIAMLTKYQFLKKNHMVQQIFSNALLDTIKIMLLDHYA